MQQRRSLSASDTFFGHNAQEIHFGLADAPLVDSLTVIWPTGDSTVIVDVIPDQTLSVRQCYDPDNDLLCFADDPCPEDSLNDGDGDGFCADADNCPTIANAGQHDADSDGIGDACCCVGQRGDINGDGTEADPIDLSSLVDYLFASGMPPGCPAEADINGDSVSADPIDLSSLVDFLFASGPAPSGC